MWRSASQCLWCPIGLIHTEHAVLQRTSFTTTTKSATFTAQTSHDWHALMSEKLSIGNKNHGSCVNNEVGTASSMRPSAAWDIWDKVWRAKKDVFALFVFFLLSETVAPLLFLLKQTGASDVTRKLVYSEEAQFTWSWYYSIHLHILGKPAGRREVPSANEVRIIEGLWGGLKGTKIQHTLRKVWSWSQVSIFLHLFAPIANS